MLSLMGLLDVVWTRVFITRRCCACTTRKRPATGGSGCPNTCTVTLWLLRSLWNAGVSHTPWPSGGIRSVGTTSQQCRSAVPGVPPSRHASPAPRGWDFLNIFPTGVGPRPRRGLPTGPPRALRGHRCIRRDGRSAGVWGGLCHRRAASSDRLESGHPCGSHGAASRGVPVASHSKQVACPPGAAGSTLRRPTGHPGGHGLREGCPHFRPQGHIPSLCHGGRRLVTALRPACCQEGWDRAGVCGCHSPRPRWPPPSL